MEKWKAVQEKQKGQGLKKKKVQDDDYDSSKKKYQKTTQEKNPEYTERCLNF